MRRRENDDDQPQEDWLTWFRRIVRLRGYDIDSGRGGGAGRLAVDSGLAQATMSRILAGAVPGYESAVALSRTLGIPLPLLLIRTGKATEEDFPRAGSINDPSGVLSGNILSPEEVAVAAGVPEEDRAWFQTMVRRLRREDSDDGDTAGGVAVEG